MNSSLCISVLLKMLHCLLFFPASDNNSLEVSMRQKLGEGDTLTVDRKKCGCELYSRL